MSFVASHKTPKDFTGKTLLTSKFTSEALYSNGIFSSTFSELNESAYLLSAINPTAAYKTQHFLFYLRMYQWVHTVIHIPVSWLHDDFCCIWILFFIYFYMMLKHKLHQKINGDELILKTKWLNSYSNGFCSVFISLHDLICLYGATYLTLKCISA